MNRFCQEIPSYVERGDDPIPCQDFETLDELLALKPLAYWASQPTFSHFALDGQCVMAILDEGFWWWVVGYVANPKGIAFLGLPSWDGGAYPG